MTEDGVPMSARDTPFWPGGVALMYLDKPAGTLPPAQVAFLLRHDVELIELLMQDELDEAQEWAYQAHRCRLGDPDPDLVAASRYGTEGLAEACLDSARIATVSAQAKRYALAFLRTHPRPAPQYCVEPAMERVQAAAELLAVARRLCVDLCGTDELCDRHRRGVELLQARQDARVAEMHSEMLSALAAEFPDQPRVRDSWRASTAANSAGSATEPPSASTAVP